jgi:hypothetical protein
MLSLEEKQDLLIKKWKKFHPTFNGLSVEDIRAQVQSLKGSEVKSKPPVETSETPFERLARSIWNASGRDIKTIVPEGVKNQSWYLLNLKGPIEWHGNVAVGADKQFDGWVGVVPPAGCMISYFGPGAIDRAREMAVKLGEFYP